MRPTPGTTTTNLAGKPPVVDLVTLQAAREELLVRDDDPDISGGTGTDPILAGLGNLDPELVERRILDGRTVELSYRPTVH